MTDFTLPPGVECEALDRYQNQKLNDDEFTEKDRPCSVIRRDLADAAIAALLELVRVWHDSAEHHAAIAAEMTLSAEQAEAQLAKYQADTYVAACADSEKMDDLYAQLAAVTENHEGTIREFDAESERLAAVTGERDELLSRVAEWCERCEEWDTTPEDERCPVEESCLVGKTLSHYRAQKEEDRGD